MPLIQEPIDCPNPHCGVPGALALCVRFAHGFGLQLEAGGARSARWDDVHCLVCGHFSTPYASAHQEGSDLSADADWLRAVGRALRQAGRGRLPEYLLEHELGLADLLSMRRTAQRMGVLQRAEPDARAFPQVAVLRVSSGPEIPAMFGVAHGEGESEPFARKVRVLGRLLGADAADTLPRHCAFPEPHASWFFYHEADFVGLLWLEPNRSYRGTLTIDGCLERLLRAG